MEGQPWSMGNLPYPEERWPFPGMTHCQQLPKRRSSTSSMLRYWLAWSASSFFLCFLNLSGADKDPPSSPPCYCFTDRSLSGTHLACPASCGLTHSCAHSHLCSRQLSSSFREPLHKQITQDHHVCTCTQARFLGGSVMVDY